MGQANIIKVLEKSNRRLTVREISKILHINQNSVNRVLKKLCMQGAVSRKEIKPQIGHSFYEYKIK